MLTAFIVLAPLYFLNERITFGQGFGWDGKAYGLWARNFVEEVVRKKPDQYYIQRIFPSALVYGGLHLARVEATDSNIIDAFALLDVIMLVVCAWGWCRIADELQITARGKWFGAIALFVNAAVMKYLAYYPVLTDLTSYALGVLMLLCYLRGRSAALYLLTIAGAFTWPTILYCGAVMLLFARRKATPQRPAPPWARALIAGSSTFVIVAATALLRVFGYPGFVGHPGGMPLEALVPTSLALVALYWMFGSYLLADGNMLRSWRPWLAAMSPTRCLAVLSLLALRWLQIHELASKEGRLDLTWRLNWTLFTSIMKPGVFLVAHVVYFGPIVLLAVFLWKPLCRLVRRDGIGLTLCTLLLLGQSLCSESRGLMNLYPILVAYAVKLTESLRWRTRDYVFFALVSLAFSKVWLMINTDPWGPGPLVFPNQKLMMNCGPWMSNSMYVVQGAAVAICALVFYFALPLRLPAANAASVPASLAHETCGQSSA